MHMEYNGVRVNLIGGKEKRAKTEIKSYARKRCEYTIPGDSITTPIN